MARTLTLLRAAGVVAPEAHDAPALEGRRDDLHRVAPLLQVPQVDDRVQQLVLAQQPRTLAVDEHLVGLDLLALGRAQVDLELAVARARAVGRQRGPGRGRLGAAADGRGPAGAVAGAD